MKQIKLIFVMALSCVLTLGIAGQQSTSATVPGNNQFLVTNMSGAKSGGIPTDMSGDGRYIVFSSWASDLVPNDTNNKEDVFVKDRVNNTFTRVSIATNGTQSDNKSWNAKISSDGRYVVFQSLSTTFGVRQTFGD